MQKFTTVIQQLKTGEVKDREFKPLQVEVRSDDEFYGKAKLFASLVQKERILSIYKEKQQYEKPSVKKRRKAREAVAKKLAMDAKQRMIESGEWEKIQKQKVKRRQEKDQKKRETND